MFSEVYNFLKMMVITNGKEIKRYNEAFSELSVLGIGSFGIVCEAKEKSDNKIYAIKKYLIKDENYEKLNEDLDIMLRMKSDYLVDIKSLWFENNNSLKYDFLKHIQKIHKILYIQMELCSETLQSFMDKIREELKSNSITALGYFIASELSVEILECVNYLHKQHVIHRDLRPTNIMIKYDRINGRFIKLGDFCLAKIHFDLFEEVIVGSQMWNRKFKRDLKYTAPELKEFRLHESQGIEKQMRIKWNYTAPEVLGNGKHAFGSDVYSLALVFRDLFIACFNNMCFGMNLKLKTKYENFCLLLEKMTNNITNSRLNCEDILHDKNSWALNLKELADEILLHDFGNNTHSHFILTKWKFHYFKLNSKHKVTHNLHLNNIYY